MISDTRNSIFSSKHQCFFKIQCFLPLIRLNGTSLSWLGPSFLTGQAPTFFHALFMFTYLVSLDSISSPPWADRDPALRRHGLAFSFVVAASRLLGVMGATLGFASLIPTISFYCVSAPVSILLKIDLLYLFSLLFLITNYITWCFNCFLCLFVFAEGLLSEHLNGPCYWQMNDWLVML